MRFYMIKRLVGALTISVSLGLLTGPSAKAGLSTLPAIAYRCYMINAQGVLINLELVCDPNARLRAAAAAKDAERRKRALKQGEAVYCNFLTEATTLTETKDSKYKLSVPAICEVLKDANGLTLWMQLKENGNRILGETSKSHSLVQAGDTFIFDAEFFGEFALNPAKEDLSVIYLVR
ncbi:MAG: hypothetical protein KGQ93_10540 [Cyanobacteria bacterium REEB459]|nr:hypothetical protein [Cyanobacteria bacterium REEB459]